MSHFCVFVFSKEQLDTIMLQNIMVPWHEFECTGLDNQYIVDVDETEKLREQFAKQTKTMCRQTSAVAHLNGRLVDAYDPQFYRDPTAEEAAKIGIGGTGSRDGLSYHSQDWGDGKGYRAKVHFIPDGWVKEEVRVWDLMTEAEFAEDWFGRKAVAAGCSPDLKGDHKYGYVTLDDHGGVVKMINRTNPNKKWDWYSVGGRWTGTLVPHYEPSEDPNNKQTCWLCNGTGTRCDTVVQGKCNGCEGTGIMTKWPTQWKSVGDQARLQDVPVVALRNIAEEKALRRYDAAMKIISKLTGSSEANAWEQLPNWDAIKDDDVNYADIDAKRNAYWDNPVMKALQKAKDANGKHVVEIFNVSDLRTTRTKYAQRARNEAFCAFSLVDARGDTPVWHERGEMGMFGMVFDEKDKDKWAEEFSALVDAMDLNTWVTVVDCHI